MKQINTGILLIILLVALILPVRASTSDSVKILVADSPTECLFLEGIFVEGDGYILIDGRNNTGRVKFADSEGAISGAVLSTIPLPDAASLPGDILPSPWGLDRVVPTDDYLWSIPAPWAGSVAEKFDKISGEFLERLPDPGAVAAGVAIGPYGDTWIISRRIILNVTSGDFEVLNLGTTIQHIDTAVGHPLGFVVLQQPDIFLVDTNGMIRWNINLDGVVDFYISPIDIACGSDGTIAVAAALTDLSDDENRDEYNSLREEALGRDDEDVLFSLEDALRVNLCVGYILLLIDPEGTITDAIEIGSPPVACAVDPSGRAHILTETNDGWTISILDPRLDQGFKVADIPHGTPTMVAPHRLVSALDGSLYWDDVTATESGEYWGIAKLSPSSPVFSLGGIDNTDSSGVSWVYREPGGNFVRQTSAIAVDSNGEIRVGVQDFSFDVLNDPGMEFIENLEAPYTSSLLTIDSEGNLVRNESSVDIVGVVSPCVELVPNGGSLIAAWAGMGVNGAIGILNNDAWVPSEGLNFPDYLLNAKIGFSGNGFFTWMNFPDGDGTETRWFEVRSDLSGGTAIDRLEAIEARFLESDRVSGNLWVTIDDGEIFQLDSDNLNVTGIWNNRLPSGAPGHPLDDAAKITDGLAVLDREHRAIFLVEPDGFTPPTLASQADIDDAISAIRAALGEIRERYGTYPPPSLDLLENILTYSDLEMLKWAFIGGRIFHYRPSETSYTFVVWSGTAEQPVLIVSEYNIQVIY